ncbi:MAG TPA: hypothetical protein VF721_18905 [Pyrinomonadaceae bacterium]
MNTKIIRRLLVLAMLLTCLGWFSIADTGNQIAYAAPCCQSCPGGGDPTNVGYYCQNQCGERSGTCYNNCVAQGNNCYGTCVLCGDGSPWCSTNEFCQYWGYSACSGGYCVY